MKKAIVILMALSLMLSLCACGPVVKESGSTEPVQTQGSDGENSPAESTAPSAAHPAEPGFAFSYNGVEIVMNAPAEPIIEALGEPKSYTEETSCAFEGLDKTYYYGSFYLQTYPMDGGDFIYCLWLVDDSVTNAEGIYIGAPEAMVEEAYGADAFNGSNAYIAVSGDSRISVIIENGVVTSIQYDAVIS